MHISDILEIKVTAVAIVFILSVVQSILGVGLLVFGTPTFMLMGYSFIETLGIVLPPSIAISFFQVLETKGDNQSFRSEFNRFVVPFVGLGLILILTFEQKLDLARVIGMILIISSVIRFSKGLENRLIELIARHRRTCQIILGSVHGLTNMGGGLLTLYSASIHHNDKTRTRGGIAYGYLIMGVMQYSLLMVYHYELFQPKVVLYMVLAIVTYFGLGRKIFSITHEKVFGAIVTFVILFYGLALIASRRL